MSTSIGNWNVKISGDISGFQSALKTASNLAGQFSRQFNLNQLLASSLGGAEAKSAAFNATLKSMVSQIPYVGGAFAAATDGAQGFLSFIRDTTRELATNIKAADALGADYNDFAAITQKLGGDTDKTTRAFKEFNLELSKATSGSSESREKFEKGVGLNPDKLRAMGFSEQIREVEKAFKGLGNSVDATRSATELFGKQGIAMLQVFAAGVDNLREHIALLSPEEQQLAKGAVALRAHQQAEEKKILTRAVVSTIPTQIAYDQYIDKLKHEAGEDPFKVFGKLISGAAIGEGLRYIEVMAEQAKKSAVLAAFLKEQGEEETKVRDQLLQALATQTAVEKERAETAHGNLALMTQTRSSEGTIPSKFGDLRQREQAIFQLHATGQMPTGDAVAEAAKIQALYTKAGNAVFEATRNPLETFQGTLTDLKALAGKDLIDKDTLNRSTAHAFEALKAATPATTNYNPRSEALEYGSAAAIDAERRFNAGEGAQHSDAEILSQALEVQKQTRDYLRQIAGSKPVQDQFDIAPP